MVTFKIERFDPDVDKAPYFKTYEVMAEKEMSVLEALFYIVENLDGSLAFRYSCRGAVCGSCAMRINGKNRLACQTLIKTLRAKTITVSALPHLPVIKDLVVDMDHFFAKYEKVKPYLINPSPAPAKERTQSVKERARIDEMINCILCGACYSACTVAATDPQFLGPAALTKAYRFLADSRDAARGERLKLVDGEHGALRCHTLFNCAEACPKYIVPTYSIQKLKGGLYGKQS
ncbi:succinate dehydrogenase iron-sulfur subunit [candidate division WOR-1 bacterium RIFCSPLOWO2_02_FULL_46_20]|uniref:Fumarate reductase iron-sulfur subunit n=2 Tax=Saganbacteria TaxID=1703751 RepID=A0A1F4RDT7_UNCSA|nr:MAG: succinate dehydrogenase iron-sulfur subunit [candidate division WOR-1 bacterium RIFCSPLOWO2_02_FULL_46_20]OGC07964.1 MAG: succinate dehydrogenase iron-sulfur subunit [candidate division WOR-1 bacterium RIFCSPLOWO2_12_FULL_45_9]